LVLSDTAAQRAIVGALIHNPLLFLEYPDLTPADFDLEIARRCMGVIRYLYTQGAKTLTPAEVDQEFARRDKIYSSYEREGGLEYLKNAYEYASSSGSNFDMYYQRLKKYSLLRRLKEDKYDIAELRLIKYALSSKSNAEYINGRIEDSDGVVDGMNGFSENVARIWMKLVDEYYKVFNTFETNKFVALLNSDEMGYFLKIVEEAEKSKLELSQEDMISCIDKILKNAIKNENKRLQKEINKRDSTMPPTEKDLKNVNAIFNNRNKLLKKKKK